MIPLKKRLAVILLVLLTLAVLAPPPAVASMTPCESFAANVRVGSTGSVWDAFKCAASDFGQFLDLIGGYF